MVDPTSESATTPGSDAGFDQASWDRWRARSRARDAAVRRKTQVLAIATAAIAAASATIWLLFRAV